MSRSLRTAARKDYRLMDVGRPEPSRSRRAAPDPPPADPKRPIRLNVKPPSRLRQVMTEDDDGGQSEASLPAQRTSLSRASKPKAKPAPAAHPSSSSSSSTPASDEEEEEEEEEEDEGDASGSEASRSDVDASMPEADDATPAPLPPPKPQPNPKSTIKLKNPYATSNARKPSPARVLQKQGNVQSVESKEIAMGGTGADSDDELSSIGSQDGEEPNAAEDAEGSEDLDEEEADIDSADDAIRASQIADSDLASDSDGTPDPSKLTRRQRRTSPDDLMALSNEAQKKKFFTAEQITMRRAEMARRRKDLSEKRNEQEKLDTLDRLLHKRAPVRRSKREMELEREREEFGTPGVAGGGEEEGWRARAGYVRTVIGGEGTRVGVPMEWEGRAVSGVFEGSRMVNGGLKGVGGGRMVQVVE